MISEQVILEGFVPKLISSKCRSRFETENTLLTTLPRKEVPFLVKFKFFCFNKTHKVQFWKKFEFFPLYRKQYLKSSKVTSKKFVVGKRIQRQNHFWWNIKAHICLKENKVLRFNQCTFLWGNLWYKHLWRWVWKPLKEKANTKLMKELSQSDFAN